MSAATLTTADVRAFAMAELHDILAAAERRFAETRSCPPGGYDALITAQSIEALERTSHGVLTLARLCHRRGDAAAHDAIFEVWQDIGERLAALAHQCRLDSDPLNPANPL